MTAMTHAEYLERQRRALPEGALERFLMKYHGEQWNDAPHIQYDTPPATLRIWKGERSGWVEVAA